MFYRIFGCLFFYFCSTLAHSKGAPVTDVGSYSYFIKMIDKGNKTIEDLRKISTLTKLTNKGIEQISGSVIGHWNNTVELVDGMSRLKKNIDDLPYDLEWNVKDDWSRTKSIIEPFVSMEKYLHQHYSNKTSLERAVIRESTKDKLRKKILEDANEDLKNAKKDIDMLYGMQKKINKTKGLKESSDLQNELLVAIAALIQKMYTTQAQLNQLKALENYQAIAANRKDFITQYRRHRLMSKALFKGEAAFMEGESYAAWTGRRVEAMCDYVTKERNDFACLEGGR